MPKKSALLFGDYTVNEIRFKDIPKENDVTEFSLHPKFGRQLIELGNNKYDYILSVEISPTDDNPAPFQLFISLTGHFAFENPEDDQVDTNLKEVILKRNTAAILFPFLRAIASTVTANANIPALLLPVLNFTDDDPSEIK